MASELIEIESKKVLIAYNDDGIDPYIKQAKELVENFDYDLSTGVSRAKIASLASKVSKFKTKIDGIGKDLVAEWKSKSTLVDKSRKKMRDELDDLRDLARKPLTDWEGEQKVIKAKKLKEEEAKKQQAIVDADHELAIEQYKNHLRDVEDKKKADELSAKQLADQQRKEQISRDKKLTEDAAAAAKLQAENEAKEAIRLAVKLKQDAIDRENQAKIDAAVAKQKVIDLAVRLKQDAIDAENKAKQDAINAGNLVFLNDAYKDLYAFDAEVSRLAGIEKERLAGIQRQKDEQAKIEADALAREADTEYKRKVHRAIIKAFVDAGISAKDSTKAMKHLVKNMVPQVTINY